LITFCGRSYQLGRAIETRSRGELGSPATRHGGFAANIAKRPQRTRRHARAVRNLLPPGWSRPAGIDPVIDKAKSERLPVAPYTTV